MIDFFRNYILTLCVVAAVSGVLTLLVPNETYEKPVKLIVSLFILICLVSPFAKGNALKNIDKFEFKMSSYDKYKAQLDMWNKSGDIIKSTVKNSIKEIVYNQSGENADDVIINLVIENESFKIKDLIIILPEKAKKHESAIADEIKNKLGIDKNVIIFK